MAPLTNNPNAPYDGRTPIHIAANRGHTEIVKFLADIVENPNSAMPNGVTPIHLAAGRGHIDIVKILAPLTGNPNTPTNTPIPLYPTHFARRHGHSEIVSFLKSFGNSAKRERLEETTIKTSNKRSRKQ